MMQKRKERKYDRTDSMFEIKPAQFVGNPRWASDAVLSCKNTRSNFSHYFSTNAIIL